jgi:hypothetical protein
VPRERYLNRPSARAMTSTIVTRDTTSRASPHPDGHAPRRRARPRPASHRNPLHLRLRSQTVTKARVSPVRGLRDAHLPPLTEAVLRAHQPPVSRDAAA